MIDSLSTINNEILSKLKIYFLDNTKKISSTIPDLSVDISELKIKEEHEKFIGPSIYYLHQKGFITLNNRRITITTKGIEELEPFYIKNKSQILMIVLSSFLGVFGTIIGVVLTLIFSK